MLFNRVNGRIITQLTVAGALLALCAGFDWPNTAQRIRDQLPHATGKERVDLVRYLALIDDPEAHEALLSALDDPDANVRLSAIEAVAAAKITSANDKLVARLNDADPNLRRSAALALGKLGLAEARAPLTRARSDADPRVRLAAIAALGSLPPPHDLVVLIAALDDPDIDVRTETVRALSAESDPRVVSALLSRTRDQAPEVRRAALEALKLSNDARVRAARFLSLEDASDSVVIEALRQLRRDESREAQRAISSMRESDRPRVRRAALYALSAADPNDASAPPNQQPAWLQPLQRTAIAGPEEAASLLRELEATLPRTEARASAPLALFYEKAPRELHARILALLWGPPDELVANTIKKALQAKEPETRREALLAAARLSLGGVDTLLLDALLDQEPRVREAAELAIAKGGGKRAADFLVRRALEDRLHRPEELRALGAVLQRTRAALRESDRVALRAKLIEHAHAQDDAEATAALEAMGALADDQSVDALTRIASDLPVLNRIAVARALRTAESKKAISMLRTWTRSEDPKVVAIAMASLGELSDARDVQLIKDVAKAGPWPLSPVASYALSRLVERGHAAPDVLCEAAQSNEPVTRRNARITLVKKGSKACGDVRPEERRGTGSQVRAQTWVTLVREDGLSLITHPDGSGDAHFPGFAEAHRESAWAEHYRH